MVMKKDRRHRDVKSKLMAAVCMLLVSTIMLMSSTYAWFTLSTAPEVTGITTSVGANGNLEMALLPAANADGTTEYNTVADALDGITSGTADSMAIEGKDVTVSNVTWGNLVDLSHASYGLSNITLYPSKLNATGGTLNDTSAALQYPQYGSDGRVAGLTTAQTAKYTGTATAAGNFDPAKDGFGVRGIGSSSSMTPRQKAYSGALSAAKSSMNKASGVAADTLRNNGTALAQLAIDHKMDASKQFTYSEIEKLGDMLEALEVALGHVEEAYLRNAIAFAASDSGDPDVDGQDPAWSTLKAAVDAAVTAENRVVGAAISQAGAETDGIKAFKAAVNSLNEAKSAWEPIKEAGSTDTYDWNEISPVLTALMNTSSENLQICGTTLDELTPGDLVGYYVNFKRVDIMMGSGSSIFADIADQAADFTSSFNVTVKTAGTDYEEMFEGQEIPVTANIVTQSAKAPDYYLKTLYNTVSGIGSTAAGGASSNQPLTEMYGYIIDLGFRTNAAGSNLLLQTEAIDRIYSDNTNEATMGGGSNMTFTAANDLSTDQLTDLLAAVRVVFFNPDTGAIYSYGKLTMGAGDAGDATNPDDGVATTAEGEEGAATGGTYTADLVLCDAAGEEKADSILLALPQNTATALSVLVYLDGETITNASVSATGTESLKGSLNLQFSSSAKLVPMENGDLHITGGTQTPTPAPNPTPGEEHTEHTPAAEWQTSETHHWHACTGENCDVPVGEAEHTWDVDDPTYCTTCQYDSDAT